MINNECSFSFLTLLFFRRQFKIEPVEQYLNDLKRPKLILSHNPDSADLLRKYRADVVSLKFILFIFFLCNYYSFYFPFY